MIIVGTDAEGGVVLPGHPDERLVLQENEDRSLLLHPTRLLAAQAEYDADSALRALLARAVQSPAIHRRRTYRAA